MLVKTRRPTSPNVAKSGAKRPSQSTARAPRALKAKPKQVRLHPPKRQMRMNTVYPVILSGGSGSRLWPLSRSMFPKQFIKFFTGQKNTFLGATLARLTPANGFKAPILLCNNDHRFLVREELETAGVEPHAIILEPVARNTAAAIAVAAINAIENDPEAILAVMPSDHVVENEEHFAKCVANAARVAASGKLVLFGIKPTEPHTGYGYIKKGTPLKKFRRAPH